MQTLKREFAEAPALGERARDALEDMIPEIRGEYYTLAEDKKGKQTLGKIYPPLKMVKKKIGFQPFKVGGSNPKC